MRHLIAAAFLACSASHSAGAVNVLLIVADDLGWRDVGYNGSEIRTPNIDALADAGALMARYYVQPTCSPTRASLMTGQSALRNGILQPIDKNNQQGLPLGRTTLPELFRSGGYQTALIGKWHLGHAFRDLLPRSRGFEQHYGHWLGGVGHWDHVHGGGLDWQRDGEPVREQGYSTHLLTTETVRLIEQRDPGKPFFYMLSYAAPHLPNEAPPLTIDAYQSIADHHRRRHAAMVDEMDRGIGQVVAAIDSQGLSRDTLIWFMSDNGGLVTGSGFAAVDYLVERLTDWLGDPLPVPSLEFLRSSIQDGGSDNGPYRRGKMSVYEGGVLVPSIVYWPGVITPKVIDQRVSVQDVLPTLLNAAGLPPATRQTLDGVDQWPLLAGTGSTLPSDLVTVGVDGEAYYQGDWKLIRNTRGIELYDLSLDPHEQDNLAEQEAEVADALLAELTSHPRGESIHNTSLWLMLTDLDQFGGPENRAPWAKRVRERPPPTQ